MYDLNTMVTEINEMLQQKGNDFTALREALEKVELNQAFALWTMQGSKQFRGTSEFLKAMIAQACLEDNLDVAKRIFQKNLYSLKMFEDEIFSIVFASEQDITDYRNACAESAARSLQTTESLDTIPALVLFLKAAMYLLNGYLFSGFEHPYQPIVDSLLLPERSPIDRSSLEGGERREVNDTEVEMLTDFLFVAPNEAREILQSCEFEKAAKLHIARIKLNNYTLQGLVNEYIEATSVNDNLKDEFESILETFKCLMKDKLYTKAMDLIIEHYPSLETNHFESFSNLCKLIVLDSDHDDKIGFLKDLRETQVEFADELMNNYILGKRVRPTVVDRVIEEMCDIIKPQELNDTRLAQLVRFVCELSRGQDTPAQKTFGKIFKNLCDELHPPQ
ncbi:hypothetical protein PCE1_002652 [Barthelona sp. PCE]